MENLVQVRNMIYDIRKQKVMIDFELAELYEVETKYLNRAVKRNIERFPSDFMFQLTRDEWNFLRCQIGTSKIDEETRGGRQYLPYVFTEQGIAMLSSVLNSERAIQVNIQIMNTFVRIREMIISNQDLRRKIEVMERKYDKR